MVKIIMFRNNTSKIFLLVLSGISLIVLLGYELISDNPNIVSSLLLNGDFEEWEGTNLSGWLLSGNNDGVILQDDVNVKSGGNAACIKHLQNTFVALFQDVDSGKLKALQGKDYIFSLWAKTDQANSVSLSLDNNGKWESSPAHSGSGNWERLIVRGKAPQEALKSFRLHLLLKNNVSAYIDNASLLIGDSKELDALQPKGIEYLMWSRVSNRQIYRSRQTDLSMSFGDENNIEGFFYQNFFSYDFTQFHDYFCTPDDVIIAYDEQEHFLTKALALNWKRQNGVSDDNAKAFLEYDYKKDNGFNKYALEGSNYGSVQDAGWELPPADISVRHEMDFDKNYVPMEIRFKNTYDKPLHYIYVFQDGALMTGRELVARPGMNQKDVHQYWDDGDYEFARVLDINQNKDKINNWVGMYNDREGGIFAGTYVLPGSSAIWHATWDSEKSLNDNLDHNAGIYVDFYKNLKGNLEFYKDDWYRVENLLKHVDTPNDNNAYNNSYSKIHATAIDFGVLQPGEEATEIIFKIMFTGYKDREDMHKRIDNIVKEINVNYLK